MTVDYRVIRSALLVAGLLASPGNAWAQAKPIPPRVPAPTGAPAAVAKPVEAPPVSSVPQATTAVFGDWALQCRRVDASPASATSCEVNQALQVQGQGTIAQIAMGHPPATDGAAKEPLRVVVVLPNNVSFAGAVQMAVDEKDKPVDLTFRRCLPSGCYADAEAKDEFLLRWRAQGERGRLTFKDGSNRPVLLPFSFRGLAQALDALAKS